MKKSRKLALAWASLALLAMLSAYPSDLFAGHCLRCASTTVCRHVGPRVLRYHRIPLPPMAPVVMSMPMIQVAPTYGMSMYGISAPLMLNQQSSLMLGNPLLANPLLGRADLARLQGLALARALEEAQKARQRAASNPQGNPQNSATPRSAANDSRKDLFDIRIRNLENRVDRLDQRMSKVLNALERHCQALDSMHQKTAPRPKPIPQVIDDIRNIETPTLDPQR